MPTRECKCGARYRFPESAVGKRAKCQKCGTVLILEAEADQGVLAIADEPAAPQPSAPVSAACLPSAESPGRLGHVVVEEAAVPPSYAGALLRTLLFPTVLANFLTFVFICALIFISAALLPAAGCVGVVGQVVVLGWYTTFRFSVIEGAAAGEKELPTLALTSGAFDDIIAPLFKWLGSWAVVLFPAFVSLIVMWHLGLISPSGVIRSALQGVDGLLAYATPDMIVFALLVCAGMALWPMIVLCVALGGFDCLARPDLIIATLFSRLGERDRQKIVADSCGDSQVAEQRS